ncbi:hypothetical protein M378DRAFT_90088, partial [Amanita muscaria Koide BX008]
MGSLIVGIHDRFTPIRPLHYSFRDFLIDPGRSGQFFVDRDDADDRSPFSASQPQAPFPALYLYPINDFFIPKHIALFNNQRVKIGRQTNAKTAPGERNGYFNAKTLSRQHAEVWEYGGKIFIKDLKSSNGTFINGEQLSQDGFQSEPFELKSDDIVVRIWDLGFGIDLIGEDNKTINHHKVAARVVCVFNEQDVQAAARA